MHGFADNQNTYNVTQISDRNIIGKGDSIETSKGLYLIHVEEI